MSDGSEGLYESDDQDIGELKIRGDLRSERI